MTQRSESTRRKALLCLFFSAAISIVWGATIAIGSYSGLPGFKGVFYAARCVIRSSDPYRPAVMQQVYESEGGKYPMKAADAFLYKRALLVCVNLPTGLFLIAPFAVLPWKYAVLIWMALNIVALSTAAYVIWVIAGDSAIKPATLLIALVLANSVLIFAMANLSGIAVSFCIIAVACFLEDRFVRAGVLCFGISLVLKPHIGGLVWIYFLLAGGVYRKRALQTLLLVSACVLASVLWISHVAPQWPQELSANIHALSARGGINDPGPNSLGFRYVDIVISLQSTLSLICDDPGFYNFASYLICGLLLIAGAVRTLQSPFTKQNAWFALASIAMFSMLPVYHRTYDAKLLLLAIPACALLWREGGGLKWIAGLMTTLAIASTSDVPVTILLGMMKAMRNLDNVQGRLLTAFIFHPAPLILLATGSFYLWVYFQRTAGGIEADN